MIDKNKMPVTIGVSFVWFTTQFGGGFASGNQLRSFFIRFGVWALFTCIFVQGIGAFYQWYALRYAKKHNLYDYRSFNNRFYGKYAPIFSNLYELVYLTTTCVAPAAAFATGVSTMNSAFNIPMWLGNLIVGIFIFVVSVYGTNVVRKVASTLSVLIVLGLLAVYLPNIISQWQDILSNISNSWEQPASFLEAIKMAIIYAAFQLASIGLIIQHSKPFESEEEAKTSMIIGFFVNGLICLMAVLGLMAVTHIPEFQEESIPLLILVNRGVAPEILRPIISILIVLGSISTAVNMIAGMTNRVCASIDTEFDSTNKPNLKVILVTLACTLVAFGIASFGLNKIVAVGYKYLGYLTIPVIMIPYIVHMVVTKFDSKTE